MRRVWVGVACAAVVAACGSGVRVPGTSPGATPSPLCGPPGDWTAGQLAGAALPEDAAPSPLALAGSHAEDAAALQSATPRPGGDVLAGYLGGFRRDWTAGGGGAAFVELWAFDSDAAASAWQSQLGAGQPTPDASASAAPVTVPGGVEYPSHNGFVVLAERSRVVMEVGIAGVAATQAGGEGLARTQYDRLCRS